MVEQFGLAMMPFGRLAASRLAGVLFADVDDQRALASRDGRPLARGSTTCREEGQVHAFEDLGRDFDHAMLGTLERHGPASASSGCHGHELGDWECALLEHAQHLRAHHSGGSDHRNLESLNHRPWL